MRSFAIIVLCLALLAGCTSMESQLEKQTTSRLSGVESAAPDEPGSGGRFMGNLRHAMKDHVNDCVFGWGITANVLAEQTATDWNRTVRLFR